MKRFLLFVPILLLLPVIVVFDTLMYFITRPACLNCGNLVEFLKSSSLTIFILGGIGYKLKGRIKR
ncbi:hypothetical protein HY357_01780 [Candidatus Roizmanbacteria bacterium]|nr:hypothetical protein [Candidatus Roizmanbacteria bacterium]